MSEESKSKGATIDQHHHYGTFQGVPSYSQLAMGFPQPVPPPESASAPYYPHGYQAVPDCFFVDGKRPIAFAKVEIVEGADLKPSDPNGLADPYVKGHLGPYRFRTKTQRKTLAPKWQEEFKIPICTWDSSNILVLEVRDKDHFVDDTLGDCSVNISELRGGQRHDKWLPLQKIKMGRLHLAITVADVDGKEREHISDEDLIKSKQGPGSKASEAPEHDFAHTRHSENASKLADNFEPINIGGQSETGIWVHHPRSEGSRVWEPRKAKARCPETQLLREDCETIDSTRSVGSGSHHNGLSSDEEKVGRPRSFGSIRTSLRKIGSMFHKDKNEDSQNMGGVPVVATPRVNIRAVGDKVPVVKLVVDRVPEPFAGTVDKESPSHEKAKEASPGSGNVKDKAKSFLKPAGHNLKHVMSKKGSDKIKSGPSLSPAAEDGCSKSDSSDDNPFRIMLDEESSATSRDCTQKVGGLPADSLAAEVEYNHVHIAVAPGDAKGSPFRDVDGSDAEERSDRKGSFRDMDMSGDDVSDAEERSDRKGSFRDVCCWDVLMWMAK